jgi:hypothetical protein
MKDQVAQVYKRRGKINLFVFSDTRRCEPKSDERKKETIL